MNLKAIETFFWVARLGSLRAAAAQLNAPQSTISARIRELERVWGVTLFERQARGICPTSRGQDLLKEAERLLEDVGRLQDVVERKKSQSGKIRIGSGEIVAITWLSPMLAALSREHPDLIVDLDIDLSINLRRKIDRGDIDLAFVVGPVHGPHLHATHLVDVDMRWMGHERLVDPAATLGRDALTRLPIVTLSRDSDLFLRLQDDLTSDSIFPERLHACSTVSGMIRLVAHGFALAVIPPCLTAGLSGVHELRRLSPMPSVSFFSVVQRRRKTSLVEAVEQQAIAHAATWREAIAGGEADFGPQMS